VKQACNNKRRQETIIKEEHKLTGKQFRKYIKKIRKYVKQK